MSGKENKGNKPASKVAAKTAAKPAAAGAKKAAPAKGKLGVKAAPPKAAGKGAAKSGQKKTGTPRINKFRNVLQAQRKKFQPTRKGVRGIGKEQPKRDLSRYIKWPRYIRVQKQRKILMIRLKVPPTLFQFTRTLDRRNALSILSFANKYRLEGKIARRRRLHKAAKSKAGGDKARTKRPVSVVAGLNAVTRAVEQKKAKLVVIAHDIHPIELVAWLPALCRRAEVPYVIIKGKSRLGPIAHTKNCSAIAFTSIRKEDENKFRDLSEMAKELFNDNADIRKSWGGGVLGKRRQDAIAKRQRLIALEAAQRGK